MDHGSVYEAVERDLEQFGDMKNSALAATALALAAKIDRTDSARDFASVAKELREHLDRLRELAPQKRTRTKLDELQERRERRLAGG